MQKNIQRRKERDDSRLLSHRQPTVSSKEYLGFNETTPNERITHDNSWRYARIMITTRICEFLKIAISKIKNLNHNPQPINTIWDFLNHNLSAKYNMDMRLLWPCCVVLIRSQIISCLHEKYMSNETNSIVHWITAWWKITEAYVSPLCLPQTDRLLWIQYISNVNLRHVRRNPS